MTYAAFAVIGVLWLATFVSNSIVIETLLLYLFQPKDRDKLKQEASPNFERQNSVTSDASIEVKTKLKFLSLI